MATSGAHVQIIELMQQFHYTATEARLYLSLLEGSPRNWLRAGSTLRRSPLGHLQHTQETRE